MNPFETDYLIRYKISGSVFLTQLGCNTRKEPNNLSLVIVHFIIVKELSSPFLCKRRNGIELNIYLFTQDIEVIVNPLHSHHFLVVT